MRGPKGGPRNAVRRVPIPPVLVQLIRQHVKEFAVGSDGRLFRTYRGASTCRRRCGRCSRRVSIHPWVLASADVRVPGYGISGIGGIQGWPVMASRRAVRASARCLAAVEM